MENEPQADERLSAFKIDRQGLMLGKAGQVLLDYNYIIKQLKKLPSYELVRTKHSPHRGVHSVLKSDLERYNQEILNNLNK